MSDVDRLVRRLRSYSTRAWRTDGRSDRVRRLAADLVELGGSGHPVPDLADHVLPDAVAVLAAEAAEVDPGATAVLLADALRELR